MSRVKKPFDNLISEELILVKIFNVIQNWHLFPLWYGFCKYFNYASPHTNPPSTVVQSK